MRFRFVILLFVLSTCFASVSANDTARVVNSFRFTLGAFGGFGAGYSEPASKETFEINFQGGIIYNRWLAAGIHVNTFFTLNPLVDKLSGDDAGLVGVYGGIFASPIIWSNALVHAAFPVFIGFGGVNYELYDPEGLTNQIEDSDRYWVLEPGIEIEMNILRFFRVAVGGYYRCCSKIHLNYEKGGESIVPDNFLNNFSVGVKLRFGKF